MNIYILSDNEFIGKSIKLIHSIINYYKEDFDNQQIFQIYDGLMKGYRNDHFIDVLYYSDPRFDFKKMEQIKKWR